MARKMKNNEKEQFDLIEVACNKIHGVAGLLSQGETTEDLILQKVDSLGLSEILRGCAREIQNALDKLHGLPE